MTNNMANPQEGDYEHEPYESEPETEPEMKPEPNVCNDFKYPSYDYVSNELMKFDISIDAGYGEYNHEYLKTIWENIDDGTIIKTCEENINQRGGFTALQANYYSFIHVMRLAVRGSPDRYKESFIDIKHTISRNWDGIGDWNH